MNRGAERVRKGRSQWAETVWMAAEAAGFSGGGLDNAHFLTLGWSAWYSSGVRGGRQWAPASYPPHSYSVLLWSLHRAVRELPCVFAHICPPLYSRILELVMHALIRY